MIYSFVCPIPCNHETKVFAEDEDDATMKLVMAGALRCRNAKYLCHCEKAQRNMYRISEENLKKIVRTCMREEPGKQEDYHRILAALYEQVS
jgi:hypothetical protein